MVGKKDAVTLAQAIVQKTEASATISPTPAGPTDTAPQPEPQVVEAINQVFALFRLNYHNQYYAAWSDAEQVKAGQTALVRGIGVLSHGRNSTRRTTRNRKQRLSTHPEQNDRFLPVLPQ